MRADLCPPIPGYHEKAKSLDPNPDKSFRTARSGGRSPYVYPAEGGCLPHDPHRLYGHRVLLNETRKEQRLRLIRERWYRFVNAERCANAHCGSDTCVENLRTATAPSHKEKLKKVTGKDSRYTVGECHRTYSNYAERQRVKKPEDAQLNSVHKEVTVKVKLVTEYDNVDELKQFVDHKHSCIENEGSYSYNAKNGKLNETVLGVDTNAEVKLEMDMEKKCPLHEVYFKNEDFSGINIKQEELSADINSRVKFEVNIGENWYPNEIYFENADVSEIHIKQEESPTNS